MSKRTAASFLTVLLFAGTASAAPRDIQIEKRMLRLIASDAFTSFQADGRCRSANTYRVCLIDNFEQEIHIVPEVRTSHGELILRLLRSGREDILVDTMNTSLSKGLAQVLDELAGGRCFDAVVSSTPGSNYTYGQIGSLLAGEETITPDNILTYQGELRRLMRQIALQGFPSVEWLEGIDVNAVKLRNDARKFVFIEALAQFDVPVILPYGNSDATYKGQVKAVNLLSLASNAKAYSALDRQGRHLAGFPYSPLSAGDEQAVYNVVECPHPEDPYKACLDLNGDGFPEYTFARSREIAGCRQRGTILGTSVIPPNKIRELLPPKGASMPPAIEPRPAP